MAQRSEKESNWLRAHSLHEDDARCAARLLDHAHQALRGRVAFSHFLDPHQRAIAQELSALTGISVDFDGGWENAERAVAIFAPRDEAGPWRTDDGYPLRLLRVRVLGGKNAPELAHRDYLGSLMGLQIKREYIGDIVLDDHGAQVFALSDMAAYLRQEWRTAGRAALAVEEDAVGAFAAPAASMETVRATVPSLRLDALLGEAFGLSRAKVLPYIESGKASVQFIPCTKPSQPVHEGDVLSVRGLGRVRLLHVGGMTRKGRITVELEKFQ